MQTIMQALARALEYHKAGRLVEAEEIYRQIIAVQPGNVDALHLLGMLSGQIGKHQTAVELMGRAISVNPADSRYQLGLGNALLAQKRFEEAIEAYRGAIQAKPDFVLAHSNMAVALRAKGHLDEAIAACRRALSIDPNHAAAWYNLGLSSQNRGDLSGAIVAYRRALQLAPNFPEAYSDLGHALRERFYFDEAIAAYREALRLQPGNPEFHLNLGNTLRDGGHLDGAVAAYGEALKLRPDYAEAHNNLGVVLARQGQVDPAIAAYRRALEVGPMHSWVRSNLIYALHFQKDCAAATIAEEERCWNREFAAPTNESIPPYSNDPARERRLRIGYVSPDFRDHVIGRNLLPLFRSHDAENFEIFCYSGVSRPDEFTSEFRLCSHHWRETTGVDDMALADLIRRDGVDILVDLTQHTAGNRLTMFSLRPAPVQVSFAGYPESTGVEAIEHRISDRRLEKDPAGGKGEDVHLIDSFWCYDPGGTDVEINPLPARTSGVVTFGCLNNFCKVNKSVLSLWSRVLSKAPNSRLVLLAGVGSQRTRALKILEKEGVEAERVEFADYLPRRDYLKRYHHIDIVLDTFPYNGHTTSLDALWMGVPVVSLAGKTAVSRAGLSQLTNLGLHELVAFSESEYVAIADRLANDILRLIELRSSLRERMRSSVLMDASHFARQIENAYRAMWEFRVA